jgi:hypothetical protein
MARTSFDSDVSGKFGGKFKFRRDRSDTILSICVWNGKRSSKRMTPRE